MTKTVFKPPEIAERWRCKPESVRELLESGALRGFRVRRKHWRVTLEAVLEYEQGIPTLPKPERRRRKRTRQTVPTGPF